MSGSAGVDAEVRAEFHGASHAFWDVDEGAVAEDCGVECGKEVVAIGDDAAQVFAHQVGVFAHGFADGAEDDAFLAEFFSEGCLDAHRVHHGIDGCSGQCHTLLQGDSELVEGLHQLRVDVARALLLLLCRVGVVADVLIVNLRQLQVSPCGLLQCEPVPESLQAEI